MTDRQTTSLNQQMLRENCTKKRAKQQTKQNMIS